MVGTIRQLGLEGGLWALVTDAGESIELIDCPSELRQDGLRASITADSSEVEVSIGMVGRAVRVNSYEIL